MLIFKYIYYIIMLNNFFQLIDERDRLNKDLEAEHSAVQALKAEIEALKSPVQSRSPRKQINSL